MLPRKFKLLKGPARDTPENNVCDYALNEDAALMLKFQQGDDSAFERLLERYHKQIINFIYRYIGDKTEAEDLAQNVFLNVYRSAKTYIPKSKFSTWIYVIARNMALNELRRRRNRRESPLEETVSGEDGDLPRQIADTSKPSASGELERQELINAVKRAIDSLPDNQKTAVILRRYDNFPYEEIAKVIGCSVSAIKSLLSRAKIALKEKLSSYSQEQNETFL